MTFCFNSHRSIKVRERINIRSCAKSSFFEPMPVSVLPVLGRCLKCTAEDTFAAVRITPQWHLVATLSAWPSLNTVWILPNSARCEFFMSAFTHYATPRGEGVRAPEDVYTNESIRSHHEVRFMAANLQFRCCSALLVSLRLRIRRWHGDGHVNY
jgi:hypothetical protein